MPADTPENAAAGAAPTRAELGALEERAELEELAGGAVAATERAPWGFSNRTNLVTMVDGRRLAVQRLGDRGRARHRLGVSALLDDRLRAAGIPVPRLIRGDADGPRPYAVTERIEGAPGNSLLDDPVDAIALATEMGRLAVTIAGVDVEDEGFPRASADPASLAAVTAHRVDALRDLLGTAAATAMDAFVARIEPALAGRPVVLAHGDWAPVNVLVRGRAVVGVVDWEHARLADPLFDVAWWAWIVWHHHPERYPAAAPALFETAGVTLDAPTVERMRLLVATRLLEEAAGHDAAGGRGRAMRERWLGHLRELLQREG